jgi:hypothetical protein
MGTYNITDGRVTGNVGWASKTWTVDELASGKTNAVDIDRGRLKHAIVALFNTRTFGWETLPATNWLIATASTRTDVSIGTIALSAQ